MKPLEVFLVLDVKTVPDTEAVDRISRNEGVQTGDVLSRFGRYLPPPLHRIVAMGNLFVMYPQTSTEPPVLSWRGYAGGGETEILRSFWNAMDYPEKWAQKNGVVGAAPRITLITFGGKRVGIPALMSRSIVVQRRNFLDKGALDPVILSGTRKMMNQTDKWENSIPNYMNRYSKYNIDMRDALSFGGYGGGVESLWTSVLQTAPSRDFRPLDTRAVLELVAKNRFDDLARKAGESARNIWNMFVELSICEGRPLARESGIVSNSGNLKTKICEGPEIDLAAVEKIENIMASSRGESAVNLTGSEEDFSIPFEATASN